MCEVNLLNELIHLQRTIKELKQDLELKIKSKSPESVIASIKMELEIAEFWYEELLKDVA